MYNFHLLTKPKMHSLFSAQLHLFWPLLHQPPNFVSPTYGCPISPSCPFTLICCLISLRTALLLERNPYFSTMSPLSLSLWPAASFSSLSYTPCHHLDWIFNYPLKPRPSCPFFFWA